MNNKEILDRIIFHEGIRLFPYRCSMGKLTIGIGRNLESVGVSKGESIYLAKNDLKKRKRALRKNIPYFNQLHPERQYILIDMSFQMGVSGLLKFKNMLYCLERGDYHGASAEMLNSRWASQTPQRAERLSECMRTLEFKTF